MKSKILFIVVGMIILLGTLVSAQGTIESLGFIQAPEDFIAGQPLNISFSFYYALSNTANGLLVIVLNVSSDDSNYPVWADDFNIYNAKMDNSLEHYTLQCTEDNTTINYPYGPINLTGMPGVFYCTNDEFLSMAPGTQNLVSLKLGSNPQLYPGNYTIEAGLFYPEKLITSLNMSVYSPLEKIYNERRIPLNISTNVPVEEMEYIEWMENNYRWKRLCKNCNEYGFFKKRLKTFDEGENNISIRATDIFGESVMQNISFFVDSKDPKISKTEPRRGFSDGNFYIKFKEDNPMNLTLFYGNESYGMNISEECIYDGRRYYECNTNVNLSVYDGQEIEYWFGLIDIAGNFDDSRARDIDVDYTPPIINDFNYTIDGRRVTFFFNITEMNFDEIRYSYVDHREKLKDKRLCSRLKDGICEKRKSFRRGNYNLTLNVLDEAGNSEEKSINFDVV